MRRRDLLAAGASGALLPGFGCDPAEGSKTASPSATGDRKVVVVWANGGWDVTYCMDPKMDLELVDGPEDDSLGQDCAPDAVEYVQNWFGAGGLDILCNDGCRPAVRGFFDAHAEKVAVINGIQVGSIGHDPARYRMLTGTADPSSPDLAVMIGHALGAALPLGSIDFSGFSLAGAYAASNGRVGASGQLKSLLDPAAVLQPPGGAPSYPLFVPTTAVELEQQEILAKRVERYLTSRGLGTESRRRIDAWFESRDRVTRFRGQATDILASLEVGDAPSFNESVSLAADLLSANVCQTAFVDTGKLWDSHVDNTNQHEYFETLFAGLKILMDRIYAPAEGQAPIDAPVTVVVLSEFTRTPRFNLDGGKDHWPVNSLMVMGDGVRGGRTFGGTTDELRELKMDLATGELTDSGDYLGFANVAAGILDLCGVDPEEWLPGKTPFRGATA